MVFFQTHFRAKVLPKGPGWGFDPKLLDEGQKVSKKWSFLTSKMAHFDTFLTTSFEPKTR